MRNDTERFASSPEAVIEHIPEEARAAYIDAKRLHHEGNTL